MIRDAPNSTRICPSYISRCKSSSARAPPAAATDTASKVFGPPLLTLAFNKPAFAPERDADGELRGLKIFLMEGGAQAH